MSASWLRPLLSSFWNGGNQKLFLHLSLLPEGRLCERRGCFTIVLLQGLPRGWFPSVLWWSWELWSKLGAGTKARGVGGDLSASVWVARLEQNPSQTGMNRELLERSQYPVCASLCTRIDAQVCHDLAEHFWKGDVPYEFIVIYLLCAVSVGHTSLVLVVITCWSFSSLSLSSSSLM